MLFVEVEYIADVGALRGERLTRLLEVGDDEEHALRGPGTPVLAR